MLESQRLDEDGELRLALANLGVSLLVGLAAAAGRALGGCAVNQDCLNLTSTSSNPGDRPYVGYVNGSVPADIVYPGPNVGPPVA